MSIQTQINRQVNVKAIVTNGKVIPLWMRYNGKLYQFKQVLRSFKQDSAPPEAGYPRWIFQVTDGENFFELSWDMHDFSWHLWRVECPA